MPPPFNQIFPPAPTFTEKDLDRLVGKVVIITGATSGVGYELAKMVYSSGATTYITGREGEKLRMVGDRIKKEVGETGGRLRLLKLDLADLESIKASAGEFLEKERELHVLVHNAGVMVPPAGSRTPMGHDLEIGTNCLGPFLFTQLLLETMKKSVSLESELSKVRIVWVASMMALGTPEGGVIFDKSAGHPKVLKDKMENYMQSKAGVTFLASEAAKRYGQDGIISVSVHPGLMKTELQRHGPKIQSILMSLIFKSPRYGAFTELFAGFSPVVDSQKHNGSYIVPWGRIANFPQHLAMGMKAEEEGGNGKAQQFWEWCEQETRKFIV
ncbi:putative short-chain dehydrogenase [Phaeomoniella chlamydospora]|uniref:Putative short-chain dehydrogenase n=1 Tax=Phaeomoniella chlamydospora TaxID=158046 RepID=A0A0G2DVK7_PHACM|nr:putative short-chain dehydrogenase [Phaeomoniella chlamydospora]